MLIQITNEMTPIRYSAIFSSSMLGANIKSCLMGFGFLFASTLMRWFLKSYIRNEFDDTNGSRNMSEICKFC